MNTSKMEWLIRHACDSPVVKKLDEMAFQMTGMGLFVYWSFNASGAGETYAAGTDRGLPEFCRIFHSIPEGRSRCMTCHRLLSMSESNGVKLKENVCHGGASVISAPVTGKGLPEGVDLLVVSTCGFSLGDRQRGWRIARLHARGMDVDLGKLRKAYKLLPELKGRNLDVARLIVDATASAIAEALRLGMEALPKEKELPSQGRPAPGAMEEKLRSALQLAQDRPMRKIPRPSGATLIDVVKAVVGANPQMQISEAEIAQTARITPNHFSMLFHKHAGQAFHDFLLAKRLELAKRLLRDLTLTISEVAYQSGFTDSGYFGKVFRKALGSTPSEWRRKL